MKEAKLVGLVQEHVGEEPVLAAGLFQPRGTEAARAAGGAGVGMGAVGRQVALAASMAAGQGAAAVEGVPRWTLMAVTPTRLHAFAAHALPHVRIEEPFRVWDRDAITVRVEGRLNVKVFEVEDHGDGRRYEFEGFRWGGQHARVVMSLLTDPDDDDDEHEGDAG